MAKPWLVLRKDEEGVSPVIATILMVAITVVLAAVLYVMVAGIVGGPGEKPDPIGVSVTLTPDGTNWSMSVISNPSPQPLSATMLVIRGPGGGVLLAQAPLAKYLVETDGVRYTQVDNSSTTVAVGDVLLMSVSLYPAGHTYEISNSGSILATGDLN